MDEYVHNMIPDVFDDFFSNISDIHQHKTRNDAQKIFHITFRGTTRG